MQTTNITNFYSSSIPMGREPGPDGLPWHWGASSHDRSPRRPEKGPEQRGRQPAPVLVFLTYLPLLLVAAFGWVGAVAALPAVLFNRSLARRDWGLPLEVAAMLTSLAGAAAVSLVGAFLLQVLALTGG